ncbi:hypothetical protein VP01_1134g2, partial [Puccinia sorghi]
MPAQAPKTHLPNITNLPTSFTTWKPKILGHCQQLGLKKFLTSFKPPADHWKPMRQTVQRQRVFFSLIWGKPTKTALSPKTTKRILLNCGNYSPTTTRQRLLATMPKCQLATSSETTRLDTTYNKYKYNKLLKYI